MTDVKTLYPDFLTLEDALALDTKTALENVFQYQNKFRTAGAIEAGIGLHVKKAEGSYVWDSDGDKWLAFGCGVGCYTVGFNNPWIIKNIKTFLDAKQIILDPHAIRLTTSSFAKNMALITPELTKTVVCGGGGMEANETVLKMVKVASYRTKQGKTRIVTTKESFHGKSMATVNLGGAEEWRAFQGPDLEGITRVPYGDLAAAEAEISKGDVMMFMAETVQGEGGIVVPPDDYFPGLRKICDKYDTYLILDEVQCGGCRTGNQWAWQYYPGFAPDAFTFAKGMAGGILPASGVQAKESLYYAAYGSPETCAIHTATFQDNQISGAVLLSTLQFMIENNVAETIRKNGEHFIHRLKEVQKRYPDVITEIRGRGYMIGLVTGENEKGENYNDTITSNMAFKHRVHVIPAGRKADVARIYPSYFATEEDFDWFITALEDSIQVALAKLG